MRLKHLLLVTSAAVGLGGLSTAPAMAQSAPGASTNEKVVVTGSRIRRPNDATAKAPLTVVGEKQIEQTRTVTLEQILNKLPEFGSQGASDQNSIAPGGASFTDLRNLGSKRTLVLVNGKRMVSTFVLGGQGVDLNNIPTAMIDRVEVLRDGASPVYGADAIGGVVNVIMKRNTDGLELNAGAGISTYGDRETFDLSAVYGVSSEKGFVTLGVQYNREDPVVQGDREWAHLEDGSTFSSAIPEGRFTDTGTGNRYTGGPGGTITTPYAGQFFNLGFEPYLVQGRERLSINGLAEVVVNAHLTAFAEGYFTNRQSTQRLNPMPVGDIYNTAKWPNGLTIPVTNPNNPYGNVLGVRKRIFELGDRLYHDDINTYQVRVGAKGDFGADWDWEAGFIHGKSSGTYFTDNVPILTRLQELVGNTPCAVGAPAGCGSVTLAGTNSLTPAQVKYVKYTAARSAEYNQDMVYANVTGELVELPAGAIGFAAGVEYRKESITDTPDGIVSGGDSAEGDAQPTSGDYSVKEAYAEVAVPLLKNETLVKDLSLDAAVRLSSYSNFGETTNYKVGANWALSDDLRFRANYGTGFRAPQVGAELFLGALQTFIDFVDPCDTSAGPVTNPTVAANCAATINPILGGGASLAFVQDVPQLNAVLQGNSALKPEESKQFTLGAVITPSFAKNLVLTVDFYKTDITNVIVSGADPGVGQAILDSCYASAGLGSPLCAFLSPRDGIGAQLNGFDAKYFNSGFIKTSGLDLGAQYRFGLDEIGVMGIGDLTLTARATNLRKFDQKQPDGSITHFAGTWNTNSISTAFPEWKGMGGFQIDTPDGFTFGYTLRYIGGTVRDGVALPNVTYSDLVAGYELDEVNLVVGVDNLFDEDPPFAADETGQNAVSNQYDFVGRYFYVKAGYKL